MNERKQGLTPAERLIVGMTPAERLIVAADFKPNPAEISACIPADALRDVVRHKVLALADKLKGTGVYLKVNSALRACGYGLIDEIHRRGLRVFADLKLCDIGETLSADGILLREANPELLTAMCVAGPRALSTLKKELLATEILGVTALTSLSNEDSHAMLSCSNKEAVNRFAKVASAAGLDGFMSSAVEAEVLRAEFGLLMSINTPAIRPSWAIVPGDDQNPDAIMTPAKAIRAGADRIVVGRPILNAPNPYEAVRYTIEEIESALQND